MSFVLSRVDARDMDDRLLGRVEHLQDVVDIGDGVEEIADIELFKIFVAVELLVIGVGDGIELRLVLRRENRFGVAAEIGAGHRDDMHPVAGDELAEMQAELVVGVGRHMMKFVYGNQPVVEFLDPELVHCEAERGMGADQHVVATIQKCSDGIDLSAVVRSRRVA